MSDYAPIAPSRTRRGRTGLIVTLVLLAFAAGVLVTGYAMRRVAWLGGTTVTRTTTRQVANSVAPDGFVPPDQLDANGETAATAIDPSALAGREATLAGQLASLEQRTATVTAEAAAAGAQAGRAEGLLVAVAARRALDRGVGLGYLEEQLRDRFGASQPRAVGYVIQASRQPVTLEDLRQGLEAIAPDITTVSNDDWLRSMRRELGNLIVLRREGTPSPLPADRLSRARHLLEGGQVEAARAEIARMPGASDAANWMTAANRYVGARRALDMIENAALLGQPNTSNPAAPPVSAVG